MSSIDRSIQTSRTIAATRALFAQLGTLTWPAHPVTGKTPSLTMWWGPEEMVTEFVAVTGPLNDETAVEWASTIGERQQQIELLVHVNAFWPSTVHPAADAADTLALLDRAEVLGDIAQSVLARNDPGPGVKRLGFANEDGPPRLVNDSVQLDRYDGGLSFYAIYRIVAIGRF